MTQDRLQVQRPQAPGPAHARPGRVRRWPAGAAWTAGLLAVFAVYLKISFDGHVTSDGANSALQAWDMWHGHVLLHGWIIGDATYYTFDLPVLALAEMVTGLSDLASHVASALCYLAVTAAAVALAVKDSRGLAAAARGGAVVAVLTAMFHVEGSAPYLLGTPDHTGTVVFLLVPFLLIDRVAARYAAPLLLVILCAGQLGDATVRYVAVPAIVLVAGYRAVAARRVRTGAAANALAAAVSVPLASAVRAVMLHFGGYQMIAPRTAFAPPAQWLHNGALAWNAIRILFGVGAGSASGALARDGAYALGFGCLLAAAAGLMRVAWTWRTASPAEQLLGAAIVIDLAAYVGSTIPVPTNPYEVVAILPCGAVLAARACVPARLAGPRRAGLAAGLAAVVLVLPLAIAAARPPVRVPTAALAAWLEAHGLSYGLAGYWNGSAITLHSGGRVQVRAVAMDDGQVYRYNWETNTLWFDAARHDANFVIVDTGGNGLSPAAGQYFGRPARTGHVAHWTILIYRKNLLDQVAPAPLRTPPAPPRPG